MGSSVSQQDSSQALAYNPPQRNQNNQTSTQQQRPQQNQRQPSDQRSQQTERQTSDQRDQQADRQILSHNIQQLQAPDSYFDDSGSDVDCFDNYIDLEDFQNKDKIYHAPSRHISKVQIKAISTFIHEKYEEISFNIFDILEQNSNSVSPNDLFYIAANFPEYCKSVNDMIRQSIRIQSIKEEKEKPDYLTNFLITENLNYSFIKILERFKIRKQIRAFYSETNPIESYFDGYIGSTTTKELNFNDVSNFIRYDWLIHYQNEIESLADSMSKLSQTATKKECLEEKRLRPCLLQIMGESKCNAFWPNEDLDFESIHLKYDELFAKLEQKVYRCCMSFPSTEPFNSIIINDEIVRHGICSNGTFLFIITKKSQLLVYLIYRGSINKLVAQHDLNTFEGLDDFDDKTIMFCSKKQLFIYNKTVVHRAQMWDIIYSNKLQFNVSKRPEFSDISAICSNGVSYTIIQNDTNVKVFDAENEMCIFENNKDFDTRFDNSPILLSNGYFILFLSESNDMIINPVDSYHDLSFMPDKPFPKDNYSFVKAATIDIIANSYFSVYYDDEKRSIVNSHPYTGPCDFSLFYPTFLSDIDDNSKDIQLLTILSHFAFSQSIPDHFLSNYADSKSNLINIIEWIKYHADDHDIARALLILLDFNLKKFGCPEVANHLLPQLIKMISDEFYMTFASAVLINNVDSLFDTIDTHFFEVLRTVFNSNNESFNEWALYRLNQATLFSKIEINEELLATLFGQDWIRKSRRDKNNIWIVDLLLISQQSIIEKAESDIEIDPMNINESKTIDSICKYIQILLKHLLLFISTIIESKPVKKERKINYNAIIFTLANNFYALLAPVIQNPQIATVITNQDAQQIIQLLNDEFIADEKLQLFIGYFDMIYTISISNLIRGGSFYQCEIDYAWLLQKNFNNGSRNLTPPHLEDSRSFLSSVEDDKIGEFIRNGTETMEYFYKKKSNFKPRGKKIDFEIDRFIMAAITHQTNTFHFLSVQKEAKLPPEMNAIINSVLSIRNSFKSDVQHELFDNITTMKHSDMILANLGILILSDPSFNDYLDKPAYEQQKILNLLKQFILNNDPYHFHKVLKIIPMRIEYVLKGFEQLNLLFLTVQNITFKKIIIDGISRVDSFEQLGFLLSLAELDENAISTLSIFCMACIELVRLNNILSILEILYTVLETCKEFKEKAIEIMNQLSDLINYDENSFTIDCYFMTVAGLAMSTSVFPRLFNKFPERAKLFILQLVYSQNDSRKISISEFMIFITSFDIKENIIHNVTMMKAIFYLIDKLENDEDDEDDDVNTLISAIFEQASISIGDECKIFETLPEIIYGFRQILNKENNFSLNLQTILLSITTESSIGDIFLLLSIIDFDYNECMKYYLFENEKGIWLNQLIDEKNCCLHVPLLPNSEYVGFDTSKLYKPVHRIELKTQIPLLYDSILNLWEVCIKDQRSPLCRQYYLTILKIIYTSSIQIPPEFISSILDSSIIRFGFYSLLTQQKNLRNNLNNLGYNLDSKYSRFEEFLCLSNDESYTTHLFAFNIMKFGPFSFTIETKNSKNYLILHNRGPIYINIKDGSILGSSDKVTIDNNILNITVDSNDNNIIINDKSFPMQKESFIEIFDQYLIENISFQAEKIPNFFDPKFCSSYKKDDFPDDHIKKIFNEDDEKMNDFEDDLGNVETVKTNFYQVDIKDRIGLNTVYNDRLYEMFDARKPFLASSETYKYIYVTNNIEICNHLKSIIYIHSIINNPESIIWDSFFSIIKSAILVISKADTSKLDKKFPYYLYDGFFKNCTYDRLQKIDNQMFYLAIKKLVNSEALMDKLGEELIKMAQSNEYHNLLYKRDLIVPNNKDNIYQYNDKQKFFSIDLNDTVKGFLEIDINNEWMSDTPMVLLILLWIFIDHCSKSSQRICAKLVLVNCMLIKSPMIDRYLNEFLLFTRDKLIFMPDDFSPTYIHHLSSLAANNQENKFIINFYENEKKCFRFKQFHQEFIRQSISLNEIEKISVNSLRDNLNLSNFINYSQLMKKYESIDSFPLYDFLPIWKDVSNYSYKIYENEEAIVIKENHMTIINQLDDKLLFTIRLKDFRKCKCSVSNNEDHSEAIEIKPSVDDDIYLAYYFIPPNETKYFEWEYKLYNVTEDDEINKNNLVIQVYQVINEENNLTYDDLLNDIKSFALDWTKEDTINLIEEFSDYHLDRNYDIDFLWLMLDAPTLNNTMSQRVVQCKAACLLMFIRIDDLNADVFNEIVRNHKKDLISFNEVSPLLCRPISNELNDECYYLISMKGKITIDYDLANQFILGLSNNIPDSMIYQISTWINKQKHTKRFMYPVWGIYFKDKKAIDASGVTKQTVTMATSSFLNPRTGICIISPNITESTPDELNDSKNEIEKSKETLVIPYPSKIDDSIQKVLYGFGVILGSIIRYGMNQDIPFPLFIWNFFVGKSISSQDVYENDHRLEKEIKELKNGNITNHPWVYRDWNNTIQSLKCFSNSQYVTKENADIYERIVLDLRIKKLEKCLIPIKDGLLDNIEGRDYVDLLTGPMLRFLSNGKQKMDLKSIINRVIFQDGTQQVKNNVIQILSEYDEEMMKKFLKFTTSVEKPPNLSVTPDYYIYVSFTNDLGKLPFASTCFNTIHIPALESIEAMKKKLEIALTCTDMENA